MNIIAVDDELLILGELHSAIKEAVPVCTVSTFSRSGEALEYAARNPVDVAFLDIDMSGMNGLVLAERLKEINPATNIIFVTGHSQYTMNALSLHVSGYILKPFTNGDIIKEIDNLRFPVKSKPNLRVRVQCFGNFEVYVDGERLHFPRSKAKEVFAYLVHKKGTSCTVKELAATLLEEKGDGNLHMQTYITTMMKVLDACDAKDVILKEYNSYAVDTDKVDCDYYRCLDGDTEASMTYTGEYMSNYHWAEYIVGYLDRRLK